MSYAILEIAGSKYGEASSGAGTPWAEEVNAFIGIPNYYAAENYPGSTATTIIIKSINDKNNKLCLLFKLSFGTTANENPVNILKNSSNGDFPTNSFYSISSETKTVGIEYNLIPFTTLYGGAFQGVYYLPFSTTTPQTIVIDGHVCKHMRNYAVCTTPLE